MSGPRALAADDMIKGVSPDGRFEISWAESGGQPSLMRAAPSIYQDETGYWMETDQTEEGGLQTLIHINSEKAPQVFHFDVNLPEGGFLERMPDGTVSLNVNGVPVGSFRQPWAKDALGQDVETELLVEGGDLVQRVPHHEGMEYPIIADPHFEWKVISGKIYLNRNETKYTAGLAGAGSIAAVPWLAAIPSIPTKVAQAILGSMGLIAGWAITANNQRKCLGINVGDVSAWPPSAVSSFHHEGQHCY